MIPADIVNQNDLMLHGDSWQHFVQTPAQLSDRTLSVVNWRDNGNGMPLGRLQR